MMGVRQTGEGLGITLWETEEDYKAVSSDEEHRRTFARVGALFAGPPERATYEVFLREEG
jgi:heme-degrading monooxygenase HmoA